MLLLVWRPSVALWRVLRSLLWEPVTPPMKSPDRVVAPDSSERPETMFQVGDLVALRSDPATVVPIIKVVPDGIECRYLVFQDNKKVTYYESQLQHLVETEEAQFHLSAEALHAYLTSLQLLSPSMANLYSLRSGRIQFVPYQYRPVLKLIRADRPRLLIA